MWSALVFLAGMIFLRMASKDMEKKAAERRRQSKNRVVRKEYPGPSETRTFSAPEQCEIHAAEKTCPAGTGYPKFNSASGAPGSYGAVCLKGH